MKVNQLNKGENSRLSSRSVINYSNILITNGKWFILTLNMTFSTTSKANSDSATIIQTKWKMQQRSNWIFLIGPLNTLSKAVSVL